MYIAYIWTFLKCSLDEGGDFIVPLPVAALKHVGMRRSYGLTDPRTSYKVFSDEEEALQ